MTGATIRRTLAICAMAFGLAFAAAPASAQSGQVKGKVVDAQGNPVEGAKIVIANTETAGRQLETKTNKKGEYIQVGLAPGKYKVTASKGDLTITTERPGPSRDGHPGLQAGAAAPAVSSMSPADAKKARAKQQAMTNAFSEAVELSNADKNDEAIAKFQEVIAGDPNCAECYSNIGTVQARQKKYDEAEAAYKKALELKPDYAEAYNGLANVYNAQKKFDQAAEASKKAMELSGGAAARPAPRRAAAAAPSAMFNQGVILWNAGKYPRGQGAVRGSGEARPEHGRRALSARHGAGQRRQHRRRQAGVRDLSEARADRPERRRRPRASSRPSSRAGA